jgi:hypothetical protein
MKKLFPVLFALPFILTSCQLIEKFQSERETPTPAEAPAAAAKDAPADTNAEQPAQIAEAKNQNEAAADAPAPEAPDDPAEPEPDTAKADAAPADDVPNMPDTLQMPTPARKIVIPEDKKEPFFKEGQKKAAKHVKLKVKHKKTSEWLDTDKWFEDNQFEKPELNRVENGYTFEGQANSADLSYKYNILQLKTPDGSKNNYDFSAFAKSPEAPSFAQGFIHYAAIKNDILYVSIAHRTYSSSNPDTAFILAVDLEGNVLWRSKTLVCNAQNFLIIDDTIICGYGFSGEPDFIYTIDINTGEVVDKISLRSGPDYFILSDGVIRLSTYNTDYTLSYK